MFKKETVEDIVEFVAFKLKEKGIESSEFLLQKSIYKIKRELGESHELYHNIARIPRPLLGRG